ncbi:cyclic di-GMP phosphodiesterase Gmr [Mariprofundus micogutta]|uniref:Cyclic di-GMP phosphodiesterase Gmr n=1 Tax=Mariprofundus micogutta TaxID=1921010 RepID=A0A1L8CLN8_9PROT|nr:bifunctional diguanylate cyclase/phosphodiesterase [Mariprofundus micogutta]GAV19840.1 cyclic di-GMP phosphodiesterase Gmr [Mariprofundus micogutta]
MIAGNTNPLLYDALTGLPNRMLLEERISYEIEVAQRNTTSLALIHIDPFPFSDINSTLGFEVGDQLLIQCAERLSSVVRKVDTAAHLTGDEFALLLPDAEQEGVLNVCDKIIKGFEEPFEVEAESLFLGLNMGISIYPIHCSSASEMIRGAMVAANAAKKNKETTFIYHGSMAKRASDNLRIFGALRKAIHEGGLDLVYQPQVDVQSGELTGVEALSRWNDLHISPGRFIPVAEATGLIRDLTRWMIKECLFQAAVWKKAGYQFPLSMNVSVRDLLSPNLTDDICQWLEEYNLADYPLTIEVTESSVMEHSHQAIGALNRLRQKGMQVSIDDFGTGYSSLAYLKDLPANELKIDQSFIGGLAGQPGNQRLVKAVIALAHEFGLKVVAEGVERSEELDLLSRYGCDIAQGYYLSEPLAGEELVKWYKLRDGKTKNIQ